MELGQWQKNEGGIGAQRVYAACGTGVRAPLAGLRSHWCGKRARAPGLAAQGGEGKPDTGGAEHPAAAPGSWGAERGMGVCQCWLRCQLVLLHRSGLGARCDDERTTARATAHDHWGGLGVLGRVRPLAWVQTGSSAITSPSNHEWPQKGRVSVASPVYLIHQTQATRGFWRIFPSQVSLMHQRSI